MVLLYETLLCELIFCDKMAEKVQAERKHEYEVEMNLRDAFEILQIESTDDKRVIRRAYAALVRQYHPEEHPEEWQRIHDAYEIALKNAERNVYSEERTAETEVYDYTAPSTDNAGEKPEEDEEWFDTESFFQERQKGQKEDGQIARAEVYAFFHDSEPRQFNSYARWKKFIGSPAWLSVCTEEGMLKEFADLLNRVKPVTKICRLLENHLGEIRSEIDNTPYTESKPKKLFLVRKIENKLDTIVQQRKRRWKKLWKAIGVCYIGLIVILHIPGDSDKYAENIPRITSDKAKNNTQHISLTAEEKLDGARIGDPDVTSENIIGLYYNKSYNMIEGDNYTHHMVSDANGYMPKNLELPQTRELVGSVYVRSRDEAADDVVLCMPLQEFDLTDGEVAVYVYDEVTQKYVSQTIYHCKSKSFMTEFPYIYNNVLYMQMREYGKNDKEDTVNNRNVTVILRTKK